MANRKPEELIGVEGIAPAPVQPKTPAPSNANQSQVGYTPKGPGSSVNADRYIGTQKDRDTLEDIGSRYDQGMSAADAANLHGQAEAIRNKWGYSGGQDGSEYLPNKSPFKYAPDLMNSLAAQREAAAEQAELQADYAVDKGVKDLERAEQDAQKQFDTAEAQNAKDSRKALDNHALYMEARGDRGGIGHAQYGAIEAQAMRNHQSIVNARTKLSTDTARQIADLRAQGSFKKADALLQITQNYLQQLAEYQRWGAEFDMSVEQFNASLDHWNKEFELSVGQVMGTYKGELTFQASEAQKSRLIASGEAALANGVKPTPEQMAAMGLSQAQVNKIISDYQIDRQLELAAKRQSLANARKAATEKKKQEEKEKQLEDMSFTDRRDALFQAALASGDPVNFLEHSDAYKDYGFSKAFTAEDFYIWQAMYEEQQRKNEVAQISKDVYKKPTWNDRFAHDRTPAFDIVAGLQNQFGGR